MQKALLRSISVSSSRPDWCEFSPLLNQLRKTVREVPCELRNCRRSNSALRHCPRRCCQDCPSGRSDSCPIRSSYCLVTEYLAISSFTIGVNATISPGVLSRRKRSAGMATPTDDLLHVAEFHALIEWIKIDCAWGAAALGRAVHAENKLVYLRTMPRLAQGGFNQAKLFRETDLDRGIEKIPSRPTNEIDRFGVPVENISSDPLSARLLSNCDLASQAPTHFVSRIKKHEAHLLWIMKFMR
jgi:hypothetical protein